LVASTDLSHFYPQRVAEQLDRASLGFIRDFSPEGLHKAGEAGQAFACGLGAVSSVLWAAQAAGAQRVEILHYATSAEVSGDRSSVVGYGAAAVLR
jgi:AmmeMemoRadiSam system protein B